MNATPDLMATPLAANLTGAASGVDAKLELEGFIDILSDEAALYEILLGLTRNEQRAITEASPDMLIDITGKKEGLLTEIAVVDERRAAFLQTWPAQSDLSPRLSLSGLLAGLNDDQAAVLRKVGKQLQSSVLELERLNRQNEMLLKSMLGIVADELELIVELTSEDVGYSKEGKSKGNSTDSRILDIKA